MKGRKHLTEEEKDEIKRLASDGVRYCRIAVRFDVSPSHISQIVNYGHRRREDEPLASSKKIIHRLVKELTEVDYSTLPDNVLFNPKNYPAF